MHDLSRLVADNTDVMAELRKATAGSGPYRLVIHHSAGVIAEYFGDVTSALLRQGELEDLLVAAASVTPGG